MSNLASIAQTQFGHLDANLGQFKVFQQLEQQTKIPRTYWTLSLTIGYLLLTFFNVGGLGEILSNFLGFVIPTLYSIKALKTKTKDDDSVLLAYWIVFGFMNVIEFWSGAILYLVPFYWFIKVLFLIYIGIPATGGAVFVYGKLIEPVYDQCFSKISVNKKDGVKESVENTGKKVSSGFSSGTSQH
ncbi:Yop1p KNAG_0B02170 [Huiozyma naganishii CBS 8797]|uniref:Protein YOP1 n=1 Tax=Huiozyma naganishii (strain ATCC MYA-139 / BCRC 22969 / CBS 8797 / KCTC 17520 / NBRC 10181 / NCYC 3082 / Yp74L-3) TaxID=1071383 RepID=J7S3D5_HUIN7|nr:hypothetical protein KNAG_0B02170 [Kazachstania naganishii CBS 8797]CCK68659.1 hypothetical protein KNAG_0B02170 [Kazachstania naganishii CBS 8797]